ncbi:MAG: HD domain-containing protein [Bacteroidia bacterium]|nr:HD domain-containing protein [Bacteroidia bacterium]MCZ2247708.1 HD domain-containing protein [Bacteroidia bacterium]
MFNKHKIINDPIYGFISIPNELIFDVIEHPYFQRLRRIKQLGMTSYVYPGALHTRFHHALGAMHLMMSCIETLKNKGTEITNEEAEGVIAAILLHDIGHGPFSHALESTIVSGSSHEKISLLFMNNLNSKFQGKLELAIQIFQNNYPKKFLHQLVSSQLDMDRLDYLKRDSFFTGVSEGVINSDRIISMLKVINDGLTVEAKGIYSVEKFIIARRLMYWQVYLHKTVLCAEKMLVNILTRAKHLARNGAELPSTPPLNFFLKNNFPLQEFYSDSKILEIFSRLDDYDIFTSIKMWQWHNDRVLNLLCNSLVDRKLWHIEFSNTPFEQEFILKIKNKIKQALTLSDEEAEYFVISDSVSNNAYKPGNDKINILYRDGTVKDIAEASDQLNISVLSNTVEKFFICYPKEYYNKD